MIFLQIKLLNISLFCNNSKNILPWTLHMCLDIKVVLRENFLKYRDFRLLNMCQSCHRMNAGLIQLRNEMAHYIRCSSEKLRLDNSDDSDWPFGHLPRPINNQRTCSGCPQLLACAIYQRSVAFFTFMVYQFWNCLYFYVCDVQFILQVFTNKISRVLSNESLKYQICWKYVMKWYKCW